MNNRKFDLHSQFSADLVVLKFLLKPQWSATVTFSGNIFNLAWYIVKTIKIPPQKFLKHVSIKPKCTKYEMVLLHLHLQLHLQQGRRCLVPRLNTRQHVHVPVTQLYTLLLLPPIPVTSENEDRNVQVSCYNYMCDNVFVTDWLSLNTEEYILNLISFHLLTNW